jgi:hypothetical protein
MATFIVEIRNRDNGWRWTHHQTFHGRSEPARDKALQAAAERAVDTGDQARVRSPNVGVVFATSVLGWRIAGEAVPS